MSQINEGFTKSGIFKKVVLPAFSILVVPVIAFLFFRFATARYDARVRAALLEQIRQEVRITEADRAAALDYFDKNPASRLIREVPQFAKSLPPDLLWNYRIFHWTTVLSMVSVATTLAIFLMAGLCVILSMRSPRAQYVSLLASWHFLRIYGALQAIVMGILLVALSYWVPAVWMNYVVGKLIFVVGAVSVGAVAMIISAIFKKVSNEYSVEGLLLDNKETTLLSQHLNVICSRVGVSPPEHVIAGIDDNFFVTEQPVKVSGQEVTGKTLFVSLPLLKQLSESEADAVLAHEMAHFSGQDTFYSTKVSPLLQRYNVYLHYLHGENSGNPATFPVYYFMFCFRFLFELSIAVLRREREFRADSVAASVTSGSSLAAALLRISAFSQYRRSVEAELFVQEKVLAAANVSERIQKGFVAFAATFASDPKIEGLETTHPFDTHPSFSQRLAGLHVRFDEQDRQAILGTAGDGGWYRRIANAEDLEVQQWHAYENRFRDAHEMSLAYRFVPQTPEEETVVVKLFPQQEFRGKDGTTVVDHLKIQGATWPDAVQYSEIDRYFMNESGVLDVHYVREGNRCRYINTKRYSLRESHNMLEAIQRYHSRYMSAVAYQSQLQAMSKASAEGSPDESSSSV